MLRPAKANSLAGAFRSRIAQLAFMMSSFAASWHRPISVQHSHTTSQPLRVA